MEEVINQQQTDRFMGKPGEIRGAIIKTDGQFILKKKGKRGLEKLEKKLASLGQPLELGEMRETGFYPVGLKAVVLLSIKDVFGFQKEDFIELGRFGSKSLPILRFFMKYLLSLERVAKEIPSIWDKNYTVGKCTIPAFDAEKGSITIRIEDFDLHPVWCEVHLGYLPSTLQLIAQKKVSCKEDKCIHRGDDYHEFLLTW